MRTNKSKNIAILSSILFHLIFFIFFKIYKSQIISRKKILTIDQIFLIPKMSIEKNDIIEGKHDEKLNLIPIKSKSHKKIEKAKQPTSPSSITNEQANYDISAVDDFFSANSTTDEIDANDDKLKNISSIDERSIYESLAETSDQENGISLKIDGWDWSSTPSPKDNTQETGKIVFEIVIDEYGYVISIKTLEKNVSSRLETIYRESLENISFTRRKSNNSNQKTTKGTVTFAISSY